MTEKRLRDLDVEEKVLAVARYIVKERATVRETAAVTGISKSVVYFYVTQHLKDPVLYQQVREVLDYNKAQRHLRGGMATKAKFAK